MIESGDGLALTRDNLMKAAETIAPRPGAPFELRPHGSMVHLEIASEQPSGKVATRVGFNAETGSPILIVRCNPDDEPKTRAILADAYLMALSERWLGA